ncbi:MAG TPA: NlpC/P60 family protein [Actinomycetota bacterium]|nr:NlpC/P60 family protein [Actinomycetota bacterium]
MTAGERGSGPESWTVDSVFSVGGVRWTDVPGGHWARDAIDYVAASNDWMLDSSATEDGTYAFRPRRLESRQLFARAILRAFGSGLPQDPSLSFPDLPSDDKFFIAANVAVSAGWMEVGGLGAFRPTEPVTMREVHRALVLALGLGDLAAGAEALHLRDGTAIETPEGLGTLLLGMRLGLRYNHGDESLDVGPDSALPRAEVAWSLYRAATAPTWVRDSLARYATMELPNLGPRLQAVVSFAVDYVGYPYVWGGEWNEPPLNGYCCGPQPVGGFDCSGVTWWVMKESVTGWDNTPPRSYAGWALPERTSATMAAVGKKVAFHDLRAGDLMFYDGNGDGRVDHVNTYVGNGWSIDSGSSNAGVTFTYVKGTWYQDHFKHGRHIMGS